ncbi:hypothetical protein NBO_10g0071 [Nosema bombycis CQ1]|uniref:Uncharacterized protein n=1 Tax=Nosema bombycis (strain CQ1 / CVCC 102059) TaxID=578461 RepID=R0KVZ3_NOSB1|nr:hypothetical protein NBO_10g0071 [Nosema bombycis CQ1]|eukprot:EOB15081.1 hypothetical protein NBO_10g0071 [Nosema bombycis CQ1]
MSLIKNRLVLGGNNLMIIDDFKLKFTFELPGIPTWTCLDEDGNIYYRIEEDIYQLKDGLSHRIATKIKYPLVVVGDKLIYLKNKEKITPTPHLEYHEIK